MSTIFKYVVPILPASKIMMPSAAVPLSCQLYSTSDIAIWALVDELNHSVERIVRIFPTGVALEVENHKYIGTIQQPRFVLPLVWHVFMEWEYR